MAKGVSSTSKVKTTSQAVDERGGGGRIAHLLDAEGCRLSTIVVLVCTAALLSTINIVLGCIFLGSFQLHLLTMASNNFLAGPVLMLLASTITIGFCVLCVSLVFNNKRNVYLSFGVGAILVFVLQMAAVVLAFLLANNIKTDLNKVNVDEELRSTLTSNSTRLAWDTLQTRYKCCGGRGNSGYREWENHLTSYPDSCCTVQYKGCGLQATRSLDTDYTKTIYQRLHVRGCVTVIKESLDTYVGPLLLAWALIGIIISVCLLFLGLCCFLFCWHIKQKTVLKRKRLSSTGRLEMEPLKFTSTLNVHLKP